MATNEEKVLAYVDKNNNGPLHFMSVRNSTADKAVKMDLPKVRTTEKYIVEVMKLARKNNSVFNESKTIETYYGRMRSAIDIWRHIKDIKPKETIFKVMRTMYKMAQEQKIGGQYCGGVRRRVFLSADLYKTVYNTTQLDEFGLYFAYWENIGLEAKNA